MASPLDEIAAPGGEGSSALDEIAAPQSDSSWYQRFLSGFNRALASTVGTLATPVLDPLTRPQPGDPGYEEWIARYGNASVYERLDEAFRRSQSAVIGAGENLGMIRPQEGGFAEAVGAGLPSAMAFGGATMAVARPLATLATTGATAAQRAIGSVGAEIATRPVTSTAMMLGSEPGMVAAREYVNPMVERGVETVLPSEQYPISSTVAKRLITTPIEMIASVPTAMAARLAARPITPYAERFMPTIPEASPILPRTSDPEVAGRIARTQTAKMTDFVDRTIARVLQRAGDPGLSEQNASISLRRGLLTARRFVERSVDQAYNDVPWAVTGSPRALRDALLDMADQAVNFPGEAVNYPMDHIRPILNQLRGPIVNGIQTWRDNVPARELNRLRATLRQASRDVAEVSVTGTNSNRILRTNLDELVEAATHSIEAIGSPNPTFQVRLDYANALNRMYNDRFRRGPIGDLLMTTRHAPIATTTTETVPGISRVPPTQVAREMLNPNETAEAIHQAMARTAAMTQNPRLAAMVQSGTSRRGDQAVRSMFVEDIFEGLQAAQATARRPPGAQGIPTETSLQREPVAGAVKAAQNWLRKNEPLLRAWTDTTTRLTSVVDRVTRLLAARDEHTATLLNRFLGSNAEEAIEAGLRSGDARGQFQSLYRTLRHNPDFMEGIQRGLINSLFKGEGADPNVALQRLRTPHFREAFEVMFQDRPRDLDRLYNMIRDTTNIVGRAVRAAGGRASVDVDAAQAALTMRERAKLGAGTWLAGIVGLAGGNIVHRVLPLMGQAGALGIPARMSRTARDLVASAWVADRAKALARVRDAVFDPQMEALLRDAAPGNYTDMRSYYNKVLRYARRLEALTNEDVDRMLGVEGPEAIREDRRKVERELRDMRKSPFGEK